MRDAYEQAVSATDIFTLQRKIITEHNTNQNGTVKKDIQMKKRNIETESSKLKKQRKRFLPSDITNNKSETSEKRRIGEAKNEAARKKWHPKR